MRPAFQIRYKRGKSDEEDWLTLDEIREQLPRSEWRHGAIFEQVGVAIEQRLLPSAFWDADPLDKAMIVAYYRTKSTIEAYEHHLSVQEQEKRRGKK